MRRAMAMIELIFAIVIIAISVMSIPSMMNVADMTSKGIMIDEDVLKRMSAEITKIYSTRWDENSTAPFGPLQSINAELNCSRDGGLYRSNPNTKRECLTTVSNMPTSPVVNNGDINLSRGLEQLHGASYDVDIDTNGNYAIPMSYDVSYVTSTIGALNGTGGAVATWRLGSGNNAGAKTHLKRVVVTSQSNDSDTHIVLTFFKSNAGMVLE